MANIRVDNQEAIKTLREVVGSDDLFPYADYGTDDPNVTIAITIYKSDKETDNFKFASREFLESKDGKLSSSLRRQLLEELWQFNPNQELIEKLKTLGINIIYPNKKFGVWK